MDDRNIEITDESAKLLHDQGSPNSGSTSRDLESFKIYSRRWYILFLFTFQAMLFNLVWNTWGPIQGPCKFVFGWSDFHILLLSSWAAIGILSASVPLIWLMNAKGLRVSMLLASFLVCLGKVLQVIPLRGSTLRTVVLNCGQYLAMSAGPIILGSPPMLSAAWFPPNERTTATAVATLTSYFGMAISFSVGPALVPDLNQTLLHRNLTEHNHLEAKQMMEQRITDYLYLELGVSALLFCCIVVYFPARPPTPPSVTSSRDHLSYKAFMGLLVKNKPFWLLVALAGCSVGVYCGLMMALDVLLAKYGVDQSTAGKLGCAAFVAGVLPGILLARFADLIKRRTKQVLILLLVGATTSQVIFSLSSSHLLPPKNFLLYGSIIITGLFFNGTLPLFFELATECVYPVGEGITGGIITTSANLMLLVFYVIFMLPRSDVRWMNWITTGGLAACVPGLLMYKEKFRRLDIDSRAAHGTQNAYPYLA